ncbi:sigma-54 interaction domain-containing protein [Psychromonas sp. PT13]|uniref:sigma-54 interaction domain-containing protein n=1 Tax=Psychromonas sp. PT13 TaxID=3439547 RepID=UPI003EBF2926
MTQTANIIGETSGLASVMARVNIVAPKDLPVLLHGETGSGKEVVAQLIHERSPRYNQVFNRVNCGALSPELIDSELFGHEKGSFTGTTGTHRGWFERADKGTLFLDEVGELSLGAQVRLLRVLQDGTFTRVGGEKVQQTDVRIVAATHKDLLEMIAHKQFREDLYYRLSAFPLVIPPLRDRKQDIDSFARYFVDQATQRFGIRPMKIELSEIEQLRRYSWPGNIREFASVINRAVLLGESTGVLQIEQAIGHYPSSSSLSCNVESGEINTQPENETLDAVIIAHINKVLVACYGRIEGPFGAAKKLGLNPSTLRSKMRKLNITALPKSTQ